MNKIKLKENKRRIISILTLLVIFTFVSSCTLLPKCSSEEREITGEKLSKVIKKIYDEVKVSRERLDEFEKLESEDFGTISPYDILELVAFDYQYTTEENTSDDSTILIADFIDGRRIMIIRFFNPGKVESFYLQFQSNLYKQGYIFNERLRYSDLCNSFVSEDESLKAYLLKRHNYFIVLIK